MVENLRSRTPSDGRMKGETILDNNKSVITGPNSTDLVEEIATIPLDNQMAESLSTKWTNEKHRSFLSSMEASFVKQLFSHGSQLHGRTKLEPSGRGPSTDQFIVLQSGHRKQLNFDMPELQLDIVDGSPALLENHWIKRYRPERRHREVTSLKMEENGSPCDDLNEAVHLGGNKTTTTTTVVATSSKRFSNCHTQLYRQESVGSSIEVSDQNFPIEDRKGEQLSSFRRAKRIKTTSVSTCVDVSNKDQVVPTVVSSVMAVPPI